MLVSLLLYCILGAFVGVLAGLLGLGGGILLVPALLILFPYQGFSPDLTMHLALGTSMASIIFTATSSSLAHHRRRGVSWDFVKTVVPGILIGTYAGSMVVGYLPAYILKLIFASFLCTVSILMFLGSKPKPTRTLPGFLGVNLIGLLIGTLSSFVGVGGGTMTVPYLLWHNVPLHKAIGTSAAIGFFIAVAGSLGYFVSGADITTLPEYSLGYIYLPALACIVCFSMLTAPFGTRLAHTLPVATLKRYFAIFLVAMALRMFFEIVSESLMK